MKQWRATRGKRGAMPERLWQRVVRLTERHGTYRVTKACNLSGANLNKRLQREGANREGDREPEFGFVEVDIRFEQREDTGYIQRRGSRAERYGGWR
ncbi:MAG: hypothetical protein JXA30_09680 [Deltaproteobacteria bacterium]|nr:hypothetical protein [Deltaproteobacteria bacterium]